ncbi:MAG: YncE family protein [Planctomycetota bacterium]|jgi:DNA-binding beta-propeller fold protein YncE
MLPVLLALSVVSACQVDGTESRDALPEVGGMSLLVATRGDNRITVLDGASLKTASTVALGLGAHELAVSPDGRLAAGAAYGGPGPGHQLPDQRLGIWELESGEVLHEIDLGEHVRPNDLAFWPDGRHLLVTSEVRGALLLVDAEAGELLEAWDLGDNTGHMLAYAPRAKSESGRGRVFVSHVVSGQVSVVDAGSGEVLMRVPAALGAEGIACTSDGSRVWCANNRSNTITIFDGNSGELLQTLEAPGFPFRVKCSRDDARIGVSYPMSNQVAVFDATTAEELARFDLTDVGSNPAPQDLDFDHTGSRLFIACPGIGAVVSWDVDLNQIGPVELAGPILDPIAAWHR